MEGGFLRDVGQASQELLGARPADFNAPEQVSLGARHLEYALGLETRVGSKDCRIGPEAHLRAATVGNAADLLQPAFGPAALEDHSIKRLLAGDLDVHLLRQRIGNRDTN